MTTKKSKFANITKIVEPVMLENKQVDIEMKELTIEDNAMLTELALLWYKVVTPPEQLIGKSKYELKLLAVNSLDIYTQPDSSNSEEQEKQYSKLGIILSDLEAVELLNKLLNSVFPNVDVNNINIATTFTLLQLILLKQNSGK